MVEQVRLGSTGLEVSNVWLDMMSYGAPLAYLSEPYRPRQVLGHR